MASKLAAAKIAAWSGVRAVIASAASPGVVTDALAGRPVGTSFAPRAQRLPSRKLWIAFARASEGKIVVDAGARRALVERRQVAAPRRRARGRGRPSTPTPTVEIVDDDGAVFAKGLCRYTSRSSRELPRPQHRRPPRRLPPRGRPPRRPRRPARKPPRLAPHGRRPPGRARRASARRPNGPDLTERSRGSARGRRMTQRRSELGERAKAASRLLATASTAAKNGALLTAADLLLERAAEIQAANDADLDAGRGRGHGAPGRSTGCGSPTPASTGMANGLRTVAALPDPIGEVLDGWTPAQRARDHAGARAARRGRDHLREPAQRHERRGRAVREGRATRRCCAARRPRCARTSRSRRCCATRSPSTDCPRTR